MQVKVGDMYPPHFTVRFSFTATQSDFTDSENSLLVRVIPNKEFDLCPYTRIETDRESGQLIELKAGQEHLLNWPEFWLSKSDCGEL